MLDQGCDLANLNAIALKPEPQLDVLHEATQIVALEVRCELLQEALHVGKVDQLVIDTELHLEEIEDERVGVRVRVVHVRFDGLREVIARDVLRAIHCALSKHKKPV